MKEENNRKFCTTSLYQKTSAYNTYSTNSISNKTNSILKSNLTQGSHSPNVISPFKPKGTKTFVKKRILCEVGMNCPNYLAMKDLEIAYYRCNQMNVQLKKMNEVLQANLEQKTRLYMNLLNDLSMKNDSIFKEKGKASTIVNMDSHNSDQFNLNNKTVTGLSIDNDSKKKSICNENNGKRKSKKDSIFNNAFNLQDLPSLINLNTQTSLKQYDQIGDFSNRNLKFNANNVYVSILSNNKDFDNIINDNNALSVINEFVSSENNFIETLNISQGAALLSYYDAITFLIKDYKESVRLNLRMKDFIIGSINLVESVLNNTSTSVLINNACSILDCDRASLFIYDKITDMLVVHSGEGLKKCQIKIPKDAGIAGTVFMSGKKLRIDDAYLDSRFNKEIDKSTNYRTRNILCYPLRNRDSITIGCIQAINKNKRPFDAEDEEMLNYFSQQASAILVNVMDANEYRGQFNRLRGIIEFSLEMAKIRTIEDFTSKTEEVLMSVFNCFDSKLFFFFNHKLYYFTHAQKKTYMQNIGLINLARQKKETIGCREVKASTIHNILIDLDTNNGLITFPIIINEDICAIAQVPSISKVTESGQPISSETSVIELMSKSIIEWCKLNIHLFC